MFLTSSMTRRSSSGRLSFMAWKSAMGGLRQSETELGSTRCRKMMQMSC